MPLQAILFDLDGTLLPLELNDFVSGYFAALDKSFIDVFPGGRLPEMIMASTQKMLQNDGTKSNSDAFWGDFVKLTGRSRGELEPMFDKFYRKDFAGLCPEELVCFPEASQVVAVVRDKRLKTVLATNPLFPRIAIEHRMAWAHLDAGLFDFITDYENMRFSKPNPEYFRQICEELDVRAGDCLMVGNDIGLDLVPARAAGMTTYLVENGYEVPADDFNADYAGPLLGLIPVLDT